MRYTVEEYEELRELAEDLSFGSVIDSSDPVEAEESYIKWLSATLSFNGAKDLHKVLYGSYVRLPLLMNDLTYPYAKKVLKWRLALGK